MALMPRKLLVQQGTTATPVKTPAEDWRLGHGGLWLPSTTSLIERGGVVPGPAPAGGTRPLDVTAAAGGVFTIRQGRLRIPGAAALQGSYDGVVDAVTTRTIPGASLPGAGQYKAGHLIARVYDQVYGDAQDGYDFEFVMGAPAASANAAVFPSVTGTNGYLILRSFTTDSAGVITFTSYAPPYVVARGGIQPVDLLDTTSGTYGGQYRDHPQLGLQRWDGATWVPVQYGMVRGKAWRTAGFSGAKTVSTIYGIGLTVARLSGGFTWGGGDNAGGTLSYLVIPFDGLYDLGYQSYDTGGAAAVGATLINRQRASVADVIVALGHYYKASGAVDHISPFHTDGVPLKAGDKLFLQTVDYTNSGGTLTYYGTSEPNGCFVAATYAGPLNGATPL
jgi:hypothetical protein